jgi:hypothetical protein
MCRFVPSYVQNIKCHHPWYVSLCICEKLNAHDCTRNLNVPHCLLKQEMLQAVGTRYPLTRNAPSCRDSVPSNKKCSKLSVLGALLQEMLQAVGTRYPLTRNAPSSVLRHEMLHPVSLFMKSHILSPLPRKAAFCILIKETFTK